MRHVQIAKLLCILLSPPLVLGAATPARAWADPVVEASERADDLNKQGRALADQGKLVEALAVLEEAWGLKKAYDIAGNLALVESLTGHQDRALEHVEFALGTFPASGKPEHRTALEGMRAKLRNEVVEVALVGPPDAPTALPKGARVTVNDRFVGEIPLERTVYALPGEITVRLELAGHKPSVKKYVGEAYGRISADTKLDPEDPLVPPPPIERRPLWPAGLMFGLAGAGLIVSVSTLIAGETTELTGCPTPAACTDLSDEQNALRSASVWAAIGTVAAAGVGVGLFVWSRGGASGDAAKKTSLQLLPGFGGASLRGTF